MLTSISLCRVSLLERFGPRNVRPLAIIIKCIYFFCYESDLASINCVYLVMNKE